MVCGKIVKNMTTIKGEGKRAWVGGGGKGNVAIVFQSFTSRKGDCSTLVVFLPLFSFFPPHF